MLPEGAFIPLGDWLHAQSGESLCIFEFDDEWNAMFLEVRGPAPASGNLMEGLENMP